jgi:hypothetical protein
VVVKLSANKRRTGRTRTRERKQPKTELQVTGTELKTSEQEIESPVEAEDEKGREEKIEAELNSINRPLVFEQPDKSMAGQNQAESAEQPSQADVKPKTGQKSGGKRVAENREGVFESITKMNESVFSLDGVKKAAAWYIETSERLANQALELQERATGWAKDTPLAPLFEAQHSMARKLVESSAQAARTLWQIEPAE